jgi:hypothetical protein
MQFAPSGKGAIGRFAQCDGVTKIEEGKNCFKEVISILASSYYVQK